MFRQLAVLVVAFLAVSEANHETHTSKSVKDTKSCGHSNKKTKSTTFCTAVASDFVARIPGPGGIITVTQGPLFDCDIKSPTDDDYFGIVSLHCAGIWDGKIDGKPDGDLECNGIFTVNTENNKQAKKDFSSISFTGLAPLDIFTTEKEPFFGASIGQATGLVITGANGAWGKPDNILDITFNNLSGNALKGIFEVTIDYKSRGFNPLP